VFIELTDENILTTVSRVVTGLRFVKHNRILHLQIQEGRLVQNGEIDPTTVRWVPVEDYKLLDKTIYEGQDYHTLSWEQRGFELHDVMVDEGFVVTGARFRRVGSRIDLEVLTTPFNFTTGKLMPEKNVFKDDPRTSIKFKFEKELKLIKPDIPTRVTNTDHTTNRVWCNKNVKTVGKCSRRRHTIEETPTDAYKRSTPSQHLQEVLLPHQKLNFSNLSPRYTLFAFCDLYLVS
jgi:hypothetical protein